MGVHQLDSAIWQRHQVDAHVFDHGQMLDIPGLEVGRNQLPLDDFLHRAFVIDDIGEGRAKFLHKGGWFVWEQVFR